MFGTMGISELIIILVIVLIIFGAGKLPQIGEGVGKALKGFKKEVNDIPPPEAVQPEANPPAPMQVQSTVQAVPAQAVTPGPTSAALKPTAPYTPGPEMTPGTTAALMYNMAAPPQPARTDNIHGSPASLSPINGAGSAASHDGRTRGCSHTDDAGAVPASSRRRPGETCGQTPLGHCQQGCRRPRAGAAGSDEGEGHAASRRVSGGHAEFGRRTWRCVAYIQTGRRRCPQFGRSRDADNPS